MEISFGKVTAVKIETIRPKNNNSHWVRVIVVDEDGEHEINCFPKDVNLIPEMVPER